MAPETVSCLAFGLCAIQPDFLQHKINDHIHHLPINARTLKHLIPFATSFGEPILNI